MLRIALLIGRFGADSLVYLAGEKITLLPWPDTLRQAAIWHSVMLPDSSLLLVYYNGLFHLSKNGSYWQPLMLNTPECIVHQVASDGQRIWTAFSNGIYLLSDEQSFVKLHEGKVTKLISSVYPSPVSNRRLHIVADHDNVSLDLIDLHGKIIHTIGDLARTTTELTLPSLPAGMYYIRATRDDAVHLVPFVVK